MQTKAMAAQDVAALALTDGQLVCAALGMLAVLCDAHMGVHRREIVPHLGVDNPTLLAGMKALHVDAARARMIIAAAFSIVLQQPASSNGCPNFIEGNHVFCLHQPGAGEDWHSPPAAGGTYAFDLEE